MNSGSGDGQGGLGCCNSWGRKESDTTERLNLTELNSHFGFGNFLFVLESLGMRIRTALGPG